MLTSVVAQPTPGSGQTASALQQLSADFWEWRAAEQPFSGKDARDRSRPETVDYLLVGSAIARARWELDYVRGWQRNPWFYLDQTLASLFVSLTQPPPFDEARIAEIVRRVLAIPRIIADGEANLKDPAGPLAQLSIHQLQDIGPRLEEMARELKPYLTPATASQLDPAVRADIRALEEYRGWLQQQLPGMSSDVAVGRENYAFFLKHVALIPYTPEQLVAKGRQEWERAVAFEAYEKKSQCQAAAIGSGRRSSGIIVMAGSRFIGLPWCTELLRAGDLSGPRAGVILRDFSPEGSGAHRRNCRGKLRTRYTPDPSLRSELVTFLCV